MKLTNMLFVGSLVFVLGACSTPTPATSTSETEVKEVVTILVLTSMDFISMMQLLLTKVLTTLKAV